jgi:hypothetical protein
MKPPREPSDAGSKPNIYYESVKLQEAGLRKGVTGRFQWSPELPAEVFIPNIPEGFVQVGSNGK